VSPASSTTVVRAPLGSATATVVIGFFALVASLVVLGSVAVGVHGQKIFFLDVWATPFLHGFASPGLDWFMNRLTDLGSTLVIIPVFVLVAARLLWRRRFGAVLFLAVVCLGALVLNATMKLFFQRPRPAAPWASVLPDYSFPSGHTMNGLVFWVALALIAWSIWGRRVGLVALVVALVIAVGVGTSRIYLGYHYLTDVVGGILAGIAWLLVVGAALRARPAWRRWRDPHPLGAESPPGSDREVSR
jgi:undecaprenyl-diphosphatase